MVTYARALARIGREGTGVRTFFSGHSSIGQGPILAWGNDEQKRRFLPPSARGEIVCAFGLTEPEAGSNPREMAMTYRRRGDEFVLERREVPDLQRRDRRRDRHVRLSRGPHGADQRVPGRDRAARLLERIARAQGRQRDGRHGAVRAPRLRHPRGEPARRRGGGPGDRDGRPGRRPAERRGRLPGGDRGLPGRGRRVCQGAAPARQADRAAPARAGAHHGDRDAPAHDRGPGLPGGRGQGREPGRPRRLRRSARGPTCSRPRPSCTPRAPPATPPIAPCRSSAAADSSRPSGPAATSRTPASPGSTRGPTRSSPSRSPRPCWGRNTRHSSEWRPGMGHAVLAVCRSSTGSTGPSVPSPRPGRRRRR